MGGDDSNTFKSSDVGTSLHGVICKNICMFRKVLHYSNCMVVLG